MGNNTKIDFNRYVRQRSGGSAGLANDGSVEAKMLAPSALYGVGGVSAVVGSQLDVNNGTANYTSLQEAHDNVVSYGKILLLRGADSENITWTRSDLSVMGVGRGSEINGNVSINGNFNLFKFIRFTGTLTFGAVSQGNILTDFWIVDSANLTDSGDSNRIDGISET